MMHRFRQNGFSLEYNENQIQRSILWERHCHGQYELISVLEGDVNIVLEGRSYPLKGHQTILIPPFSYHTVTTNETGIYRRVTGLFDISAVPEVLRQDFLRLCSDTVILTTPLMQQIKEVFEKGNTDYYGPLLHSLLVQFFYDIVSTTPKVVTPEMDDFLRKTVAYIHAHIHEKILLNELAAYTSRSKSSFCHQFKEKMKVTPKQYILEKKLALAEKLIAEGTPITVAAARVGYENYSNFYRVYRKYTQTSAHSAHDRSPLF